MAHFVRSEPLMPWAREQRDRKGLEPSDPTREEMLLMAQGLCSLGITSYGSVAPSWTTTPGIIPEDLHRTHTIASKFCSGRGMLSGRHWAWALPLVLYSPVLRRLESKVGLSKHLQHNSHRWAKWDTAEVHSTWGTTGPQCSTLEVWLWISFWSRELTSTSLRHYHPKQAHSGEAESWTSVMVRTFAVNGL